MYNPQKHTVGCAWRYFSDQLSNIYAYNELQAIGNVIFKHFFQLDAAQRILLQKDLFPVASMKVLEEIVLQLKSFIPVQYITGVAHFFGLEFEVAPGVLIPRPETEELVDRMIAYIRKIKTNKNNIHVLDVCTGSGCIAVALAKEFPGAKVWACDVSVDALGIATGNAIKNNVKVQFFHCDVFSGTIELENLDFVVCNPPYVTMSEKELMQPNVLNFEPHQALFVSDLDPVLYYRKVSQQALKLLKPGGMLFFEINENFPQQTLECVLEQGFENGEIAKDINCKPRILFANKPINV